MKDLYINYSPIQLAGEDVFIAWVVDGVYNREWEAWLLQHSQSRANAAQARQIVLDMMHFPSHELSNKEQGELWSSITSHISTASSTPRNNTVKKVTRWITVAAAAAVITLVVWVTTNNHVTTVLTQAGQQKEIKLPESSQVQINAGSKITYNEKHFTKDRELTLTGEAFFKVQPGSRFTVKTPQGSVTVLGTSFNVIAWPDRFEVSCYTGKVKVENQTSQVTITPGERCQKVEGSHQLHSNNFALTTQSPEWLKGRFVFDNQPLKIVVEELERQYNVTVKLEPGLEDMLYAGLFESGNLDTALSLITWPLLLKVEKQGDTVLIGR